VGVFVALVYPLILMLTVVFKKIKLKIFMIITLVLLTISLIGSNSEGGYLGVLVSLFFLLIIFSKTLYTKNKIVYVIVAFILIATN